MCARGLTLLEVVVAVAIVAILSALALPAISGRLGDARLKSAAHQLEAGVISIRAQAQREGNAVALFAAPGRRGMQLVAERVEAAGGMAGEGIGGGERESGVSRRVLASLPPGVRINAGDSATAEDGEADDQMALPGIAEDGMERPPLRLAVALPDGSVISPGPVSLSAGGAGWRVRINRFTGVCTKEPERRFEPENGKGMLEGEAQEGRP